MNDIYICDDRYTLEEIQKIRSMSDEELKKYIEELKEKEKNT